MTRTEIAAFYARQEAYYKYGTLPHVAAHAIQILLLEHEHSLLNDAVIITYADALARYKAQIHACAPLGELLDGRIALALFEVLLDVTTRMEKEHE